MPKQRFRDIKKNKVSSAPTKKTSATFPYAKASMKIKAYLTDSFMLVMPIMYVVVYLVMGDREGFKEDMFMGWVYIFVPLVLIQTLFMIKTAQTPGYRAYNLKIVDVRSGKKPSAFIILFRNLSAVLSFFSIFGWMMMFFRKDAKTLHDLLSGTAVIQAS